jgi:hypothetical protein
MAQARMASLWRTFSSASKEGGHHHAPFRPSSSLSASDGAPGEAQSQWYRAAAQGYFWLGGHLPAFATPSRALRGVRGAASCADVAVCRCDSADYTSDGPRRSMSLPNSPSLLMGSSLPPHPTGASACADLLRDCIMVVCWCVGAAERPTAAGAAPTTLAGVSAPARA